MSYHDYQLVKAYIERGVGGATDKLLQKLEQTDINELLVDLVKLCQSKTTPSKFKPPFFKPLTFEQMDALVQDLVSKNVTRTNARLFLNQLIYCPSFYDRLSFSLRIVCTPFPIPANESDSIEMITEDEIMQLIRSAQPLPPQPVSLIQLIQKTMKSFINYVTKFFAYVRAYPLAPSLATAAVLFLLFRFVMWPVSTFDKVYAAYFGEKQMYPHHESTLMQITSGAAPLRSGTSSQKQPFATSFDAGLDYYIERHYDKAIDKFNSIDYTTAVSDSITLKRDLNFYTALCYMGKSQGKNRDNMEQAIPYLERAYKLSGDFDLKLRDEVTFFLGLAYSSLDESAKARYYLSQIDQSSQFFDNSRSLIR